MRALPVAEEDIGHRNRRALSVALPRAKYDY